MSTRLIIPQGATFTFQRQFLLDEEPLDITGATLSGKLLHSASDADADAIASLTLSVVNASLGVVSVTVPSTATADLTRGIEHFWRLKATLGSGAVIITRSTQGPVRIEPAHLLHSPQLVDETVTLDNAAGTQVTAAGTTLTFRADINDADEHRALDTAGHTLPWIIATLEDSAWLMWTLRARSGEDDDDDNYRLPDDYHATTNNVIWVKSALA